MNIYEFESRTKLEVSDEEYAKIEQIYLNAESMDKDTFCKGWKSAKGATLELIEELSSNVDGKRAHINRLDIRIQNLEHDLEQEAEIKKRRAAELEESLKRSSELAALLNETTKEKVNLALALLKAGLDEQAISILGHAYVISLKCSTDIELSAADRKFIADTFSK